MHYRILTPLLTSILLFTFSLEAVQTYPSDLSIYHNSFFGSWGQYQNRTYDQYGNIQNQSMLTQYAGFLGLQKRVWENLSATVDFGYVTDMANYKAQTSIVSTYFSTGPTATPYSSITMKSIGSNFRANVGLSYYFPINNFFWASVGGGYSAVYQLTYKESQFNVNNQTQYLSFTYYSYNPTTDSISQSNSYHGLFLSSSLIFTYFENVHFPVTVRFNATFVPNKFSSNTNLPTTITELWLGAGVSLRLL